MLAPSQIVAAKFRVKQALESQRFHTRGAYFSRQQAGKARDLVAKCDWHVAANWHDERATYFGALAVAIHRNAVALDNAFPIRF